MKHIHWNWAQAHLYIRSVLSNSSNLVQNRPRRRIPRHKHSFKWGRGPGANNTSVGVSLSNPTLSSLSTWNHLHEAFSSSKWPAFRLNLLYIIYDGVAVLEGACSGTIARVSVRKKASFVSSARWPQHQPERMFLEPWVAHCLEMIRQRGEGADEPCTPNGRIVFVNPCAAS